MKYQSDSGNVAKKFGCYSLAMNLWQVTWLQLNFLVYKMELVWDGWMASLTRWTWVWVNSGSWWWTGRPGVLRFMGSQRVRHDWATELTELNPVKGLNRHIKTEDIRIANKHMEGCSTWWINRELQNKTTLRYQFIVTTMRNIKC